MAMKIIVENTSFKSDGYTLLGRVYRPDAPGRYPAVALCHGFPGDERNTDLAEEMAFHGTVFLIFYYRGAWESEGEYSFRWLEVSARDALKHLKGLPYVDPDARALLMHFTVLQPLKPTYLEILSANLLKSAEVIASFFMA